MTGNIFKIEANSEGVWLSATSDNFTPVDLAKFLRLNGVRKYDAKTINEFADTKKRAPQKIADRDSECEMDAVIDVRLTEDNMAASVIVEPPFFTHPWPDKAKFLESLEQRNVVFGIDEETIERLAELKLPDELITVATGKPPVNGDGASIEILLDPDRAPEVDYEAEKIDHKMRSAFLNVKQGDIVAVKYPAGKGENGSTVLGGEIKASVGKDMAFPVANGFEISEDGLTLTAAIDGRLLRKGNKLSILPELEVKGDVDYSVGNIDFKGRVIIFGAVRDGFRVLADSDIEVKQIVEGGILKSSASVSVKGGILGMGRGRIAALGSITASFIDQAYVRCGGDITIKNSVLHSDVGTHQTITVIGGPKSQIIGGKIQAGLSVVCNTLGSDIGTKTEIIVGIPPELNERRKELINSIAEYKEKIESLESDISFLKRQELTGNMNEKKRFLLADTTKSKFQSQASLQAMQDELLAIETSFALAKFKGVVRFKGICYPGVFVTIRGTTYTVRESFKSGAFIYDEKTAEIKLVPFDAQVGVGG